ncbi:MAG: toxin co-regulated pilus biosynthesis Q family protein [Alphaproteobacteria bacterium]|nr:toxin co-regulated pilus biosynthesis Q family protein [Alphaproteobacteria bacterium]
MAEILPPPAPTPVPARAPSAFMKAGYQSPVAEAPSQYPLAVGFGRDIPLAIALQQIVPAGYTFAFGDGANPGQRVSWDGGKPWNEVLQNAVMHHDMNVVVKGNTVWVRRGQYVAPVASAPYYPAPAYQPTHSPVPVVPAAAPAPTMDDWRPVDDWQAEENYAPSYPRRDPAAARERMMQDAATSVQQQEPAAFDPEMRTQGASVGDQTVTNAPVSLNAEEPMPLMAEPAPEGKTYMQLTGLDDSVMRRLDPHEIRYWQARQGESLREVMKNWAEQAGVQLFWAQGPDYQLPAAIQMHGTFQNAVTSILETFDNTHPQPQGQLHPNMPTGPAVLIIDHSA